MFSLPNRNLWDTFAKIGAALIWIFSPGVLRTELSLTQRPGKRQEGNGSCVRSTIRRLMFVFMFSKTPDQSSLLQEMNLAGVSCVEICIPIMQLPIGWLALDTSLNVTKACNQSSILNLIARRKELTLQTIGSSQVLQ